MDTNILPYGNISSPKKLALAVRAKRKADGLTQAKAAALCGVGVRFLSDLENGKPTVELGKALSVLVGLGLTVDIRPRGSLNQGYVAKRNKSVDLQKINQKKMYGYFDHYKNTISNLASSYKESLGLSSKAFSDLTKHRKDYQSLGIPMDKYNDIAKGYKHILDLNHTAVSSLSNVQATIDKLGMNKNTKDNYFDNLVKSVNVSKDALASIDKLQSTIGGLDLNTKFIHSLYNNYTANLKLSENAIKDIIKLDNKVYYPSTPKKK